MPIKELKPIKETTAEYEQIEKRIIEAFRKFLFIPLLKELGFHRVKIFNASDQLREALRTGKITYSGGSFRGRFNASTSKELRALGAVWDKKTGSWRLEKSAVPTSIRQAIATSETYFKDRMARIDSKLGKISPEWVAENVKVADLFDKVIWKVEKEFQASTRNITVSPKLTSDQASQIVEEYTTNMDKWIKDATEEKIIALRKRVEESITSGNRYESLVKGIEAEFGRSTARARFIARQETNLFMAKFKEARYISAGVNEYKWGCVKMPHDQSPDQHKLGNVRFWHGKLEGTIHRFDTPPMTNQNPVRYNNPGEDYNCLPGHALVSFHGAIKKGFRRRYTGGMTALVADNDMILEATFNHPIFTDRGWVAAQHVNVGDYVFSSKFESFFTREMNSKNMKASAQDVFDALSLCAEITIDSLAGSDFHTDVGLYKKVHIIRIDRELILEAIASAHQELAGFLLKKSKTPDLSFSPISKILRAASSSSPSLVSLLREIHLIVQIHLSHSDKISLGTISTLNTLSFEPFRYDAATDIIFNGHCKLTHPILIILNSVLIEGYGIMNRPFPLDDSDTKLAEFPAQNIRINADDLPKLNEREVASLIKPFRIKNKINGSFDGHVFNFETDVNWFLSADFIISNCRCFARPMVRF